MSLVPQPTWTDFEDPFAGVSDQESDCTNLAADNLGSMDAGDTAAASAAANLLTGVVGEESALEAMGADFAAAADELAAMEAEAAADTLADQLAAAAAQDSALSSLGLDLGEAALGLIPNMLGYIVGLLYPSFFSLIQTLMQNELGALEEEISYIQQELASLMGPTPMPY